MVMIIVGYRLGRLMPVSTFFLLLVCEACVYYFFLAVCEVGHVQVCVHDFYLAVCEVGQVQPCVYNFYLALVKLGRFKHVFTRAHIELR